MEDAARKGPGRLRRWLSLAAALAVGAAGPPLFVLLAGVLLEMESVPLTLALLVLCCGGAPLAGLALRERLLRGRCGEAAGLRTPRGLRGVITFVAGYVVGVGPLIVGMFAILGGWIDVVTPLLVVYGALSPTLGLIVTRALCRRWGTQAPPSSPAAAPRPVPAVGPARDRPDAMLLPASA